MRGTSRGLRKWMLLSLFCSRFNNRFERVVLPSARKPERKGRICQKIWLICRKYWYINLKSFKTRNRKFSLKQKLRKFHKNNCSRQLLLDMFFSSSSSDAIKCKELIFFFSISIKLIILLFCLYHTQSYFLI